MAPDFTIVQAEFETQIAALDNLLSIINWAKGVDPTNPPSNGSVILSPPSGLSENTMAASAIVMLASYFESFIRSQIEGYSAGVLSNFGGIVNESQDSVRHVYWRASLTRLGRIKPKEDSAWVSKASTIISAIQKFPLQGNSALAYPDLMCEHENNMRWEVVKEISGRVGVKKLAESLYSYSPLKSHLGAVNSNDMSDKLKSFLQEFQDTRNTLVHAINTRAGIGPTYYVRYRDTLLHFSRAYSRSLTIKYPVFEQAALLGRASLSA